MSTELIGVSGIFVVLFVVAIRTALPRRTSKVNADSVALRVYNHLESEVGGVCSDRQIQRMALQITEDLTNVRLPRVRVEDRGYL